MKYSLLILFCLLSGIARAQIEVSGLFLQDTVEIGLPLRYALTAKHAPDVQLTFPDSSYNFAPFSFVGKKFFPTHTVGKVSVDSVIYELQTFDISLLQKLTLPVMWQTEQDSLKEKFAKTDSVFLKELVKGDINQKKPRSTVALQPVERPFNYPYLLTGIVLLVLLSVPIWWLFGGRIIRTYRLFQFRTRHAIFLQEFGRLANRIISRKAVADIERALAVWKKHLEQIENKPYTSYTSKEISQLLRNNALLESLKTIDKAVYGQDVAGNIEQDLAVLRNISIERYELKQEQMRYVDKVLE